MLYQILCTDRGYGGGDIEKFLDEQIKLQYCTLGRLFYLKVKLIW